MVELCEFTSRFLVVGGIDCVVLSLRPTGFAKVKICRIGKKYVEIDVVGREPAADVSTASRGATIDVC